MREIIFKNTELKPIIQTDLWNTPVTFDELFLDKRNPAILKNKKIIYSNVSGTINHRNYVEYLKIAYNNDYGIEISPNHIWFTILCSFAKIIKDDSELFKQYFTKSKKEGKTKVTVKTAADSMIEMPVEKMLELILKKIPSKITKTSIIPKISTSTPEFELACAAAFLDTCSPYYQYVFYGCGYNKIKVLGTKKDYEKLKDSFDNLSRIVSNSHSHKKLSDFYNGVNTGLNKIRDNFDDDKFWERILWTEHGYISQNLDGWIIPFQVFDSHYAVVEYTESLSNKSYALCTGIFSSKIENDYLVPQFEKFIVDLDSDTTIK